MLCTQHLLGCPNSPVQVSLKPKIFFSQVETRLSAGLPVNNLDLVTCAIVDSELGW